jgi:spore maturation protein CgeB
VGRDFLMARTPDEMDRHLAALRDDPALRASLVASGLETIRARHSCAHRADELLAILARLRTPARDAAPNAAAPTPREPGRTAA